MSLMKVKYQGSKRCELTHIESNTKIFTDAPTDNHGIGESFSPTDLMTASLGACMFTIMGIQLEPLGVKLDGSHISIKKHMHVNPRRISKIDLEVHMCVGIPHEHRKRIQEIAETCPVQLSLNENIKIHLQISYPD